jgi:small subunit ribosomal protein S16
VLRIRLRRVGAKKQPSYRIVVAESTSPRDGRFVEIVGHHNPRTEPETIEVKVDRAAYWLSQGAQPSEAVERILKKQGVYDKLAELRNPTAVTAASAAAPVSETPVTEAPEAEPAVDEASASEG